jgi:hypothetical protein
MSTEPAETPETPEKKTLLGETVALLFGLPFVVLGLLGIERWVWGGLSLWLGGFMMIVTSIVSLNYALNPAELMQDIEKDLKKGEVGDFYLLGIPYLHYWSAVLLFRGIWNQWGTAAFSNPADPNLLDWLTFVLDRFLGVVLFDAPDVFGFRTSRVDPVQTFWLSLVIWVYKFVVAVGFIVILVASYRRVVLRTADVPADTPPRT